MKLNRLALLSLLAVVLLTSAFASLAQAGDAVLNSKQVQWVEPGATSAIDTTFITDENDTCRTVAISTQDWDWDALAHNTFSAGTSGARVYFVATGGAINGVSDTLNYQIEINVGGVWQINPGLTTATVYNSAVCPAGATNIGNTTGIFSGMLPLDPDTFVLGNLWYVPEFRLRVAGDQSGSTPKISGVKCFVVYPQRAASK